MKGLRCIVRVKVHFHGIVNDSQRMRMSKKKFNVRILGSKSLPNMRRGSEASSIVHGMLEMFARNFKLIEIPAELNMTPANN